MKRSRTDGSLRWWCVLGAAVLVHVMWLYVCSDWMSMPIVSQRP